MAKEEGVSLEELLKDIRRILECPFWIPDLDGEDLFARLHDDTDGKRQGILAIIFPGEGDIIVTTDAHHGPALRFRTAAGGGKSPRVRNALMLLAFAMKLDNEENPQL